MRTILTLLLFVPLIGFSQYWHQQGQDIDGETAGDFSGHYSDMNASGDVIAIGAYSNDGNGTDAGHVRVYAWDGSSWIQKGLDIDGEAAGDSSGCAVSLNASGDRVAIGAYLNDGNGIHSGHVRIYDWNGTNWIQLGQDINGETAYDRSGCAVSINSAGDRVAIGAYYNSSGSIIGAGHVRVYAWDGSSWTQQGQDINGEATSDQSGVSVSMNALGDRVAIGARHNDGTAICCDVGQVRIYQFNGTSWVKMGQDIDGNNWYDYLGYAVSMNAIGDKLIVGAYGSNANGYNSGLVRIFEWNGVTWLQKGQDINGETSNNLFGISVSINDIGNIIAVGANTNSGNGFSSGHVRVYTWVDTSWVQKGPDIDGEAPYDKSGSSVSISAAGDIIAVGATGNDGNGIDAGHIRTYFCGCCNSSTDLISTCDSLTWIDGNTYTTSTNLPIYNASNSQGCDSVVNLDLTINYSNFLTDLQSTCSSYTWIDGITYTSTTNAPIYTFTNIYGCDSIVNLDLTINSNFIVDTLNACNTYTWVDGITYTSSTNIPTYTFTNVNGCDSVVNLDLTINNSNTGTDFQTACDTYLWIDGNTYTLSTNTPTYTITNTYGCDSVVSLDLTINSSNTGTDFQTACGTYTWIDGNSYTASTNTPTYNLTNTFGCDSVINLDLTVNTVNNSISNTTPTLTADATGATYQWLDCDNNYAPILGETNQSFTATANGSYAVEVTQNGCVDTSTCEQVNNVGINEINSSITLHPNPTTGIVELQVISSSFKVDVYDYAGKCLNSTSCSTIDLSDYPSGIYLLKLAYGDKTEELRVVKE